MTSSPHPHHPGLLSTQVAADEVNDLGANTRRPRSFAVKDAKQSPSPQASRPAGGGSSCSRHWSVDDEPEGEDGRLVRGELEAIKQEVRPGVQPLDSPRAAATGRPPRCH